MKAIILGGTAMAICWCFYRLRGQKINMKNIYWVIYLALLAVSFYLFADKVIFRLSHHEEPWDFSVFYLNGKVAVAGLNFYEPQNFYDIYKTLGYPASFYKELAPEVLNVAFVYPPPTMLYFAPLGYLSYNAALTSWTIFNLCFVFGCIYLIYDQFLKPEKLNGLILVASLFFLFSPVRSTVFYSQTTFILLFYTLLIKKYSDKKISGIFLTLAVITKPLMIVLGLFFLLRKKWGAFVYSITSAIALCGLTILLFGWDTFLSYIYNNPTQRVPEDIYREFVFQSIYSVLLRKGIITFGNASTYTYIAIGILSLTCIYIFLISKKKLYDFILPILLLISLLLYPGTQGFYSVLLLFIIFQFFDQNSQMKFSSHLNILIIGAVFSLCTFSEFLCFWFLLAVLVIRAGLFWKPKIGMSIL
jgi:hypothetical protein